MCQNYNVDLWDTLYTDTLLLLLFISFRPLILHHPLLFFLILLLLLPLLMLLSLTLLPLHQHMTDLLLLLNLHRRISLRTTFSPIEALVSSRSLLDP
jgi:hypothetical protein